METDDGGGGGGGAGDVIAYIDASVIVARVLADDLHHDDAVRIFNEMSQIQGCVMVISPLVLMEAATAIRKKIITSCTPRSGGEGEMAAAEAHADRAVGRMTETVVNMISQGIIKIKVLEGWSPDLFLLLGKVFEHAGRAVHYAKAKVFRYRGIGTFDWLHFAYAKAAGASVICTADMAFADIEGSDGDFGHIRIQMLGAPLIDLLAGR